MSERTWTDGRDAQRWEVEAVAAMQRMRPGASIPMLNEVPWRLWFRSDGQVHDIQVTPDVGMGLDQLTDATLHSLLDRAKAK